MTALEQFGADECAQLSHHAYLLKWDLSNEILLVRDRSASKNWQLTTVTRMPDLQLRRFRLLFP